MASTNVTSSKVCSKCGVEKPIDLFPLRSAGSTSVRSHCKACFAVKNKSKRSSNPAYRDKERARSANRREYILGYYEKHKDRIAERERLKLEEKPKSCVVYFNVCLMTGKLFTSRHKAGKYSREGRLALGRQKAIERDKASYVPSTYKCQCCGSSFTVQYADKRKAYCSDKCATMLSRRLRSNLRRAKHYGCEYVAFDVLTVFRKANWHCQSCGIETPKALRGSVESNAPELDHIIPMAKGGGHTPSNVQCLCRSCNRTKSDKLIETISLLF